MKSATTAAFRKRFAALPVEVRNQARAAYRLFAGNPSHSSLRFKRVHTAEPVYSARVGRGYRVVGLLEGDTIVWFWIGPHDQYEMLLSRL